MKFINYIKNNDPVSNIVNFIIISMLAALVWPPLLIIGITATVLYSIYTAIKEKEIN